MPAAAPPPRTAAPPAPEPPAPGPRSSAPPPSLTGAAAAPSPPEESRRTAASVAITAASTQTRRVPSGRSVMRRPYERRRCTWVTGVTSRLRALTLARAAPPPRRTAARPAVPRFSTKDTYHARHGAQAGGRPRSRPGRLLPRHREARGAAPRRRRLGQQPARRRGRGGLRGRAGRGSGARRVLPGGAARRGCRARRGERRAAGGSQRLRDPLSALSARNSYATLAATSAVTWPGPS